MSKDTLTKRDVLGIKVFLSISISLICIGGIMYCWDVVELNKTFIDLCQKMNHSEVTDFNRFDKMFECDYEHIYSYEITEYCSKNDKWGNCMKIDYGYEVEQK